MQAQAVKSTRLAPRGESDSCLRHSKCPCLLPKFGATHHHRRVDSSWRAKFHRERMATGNCDHVSNGAAFRHMQRLTWHSHETDWWEITRWRACYAVVQFGPGFPGLVLLRRFSFAQRNWRAMLYFRIRDCNVVRFSPRRAAAPSRPPTCPFASSSAFRMAARSVFCGSADDLP